MSAYFKCITVLGGLDPSGQELPRLAILHLLTSLYSSGNILYKPDVKRACCPHYTISLPVKNFQPSRDQRQAINRWNKFVLGEEYIKEASKRYPKSKQEKKQQRTTFDLSKAVHESEYSKISTPPEPAHHFEINLEPATFTEEKYALFENYQRHVHHEKPSEISRSGFRRFLCNSPLVQSTRTVGPNNEVEQKLGSFHQCYRLDDRLIAIGVLDLLPQCVSGVYFIYHSDFEQFSFGKISALREAALALENSYEFYYMGYYIHSCQKMRYKGDYKPMLIMDPDTLDWFPLDEKVKGLLNQKSFVSIKRELGKLENTASSSSMNPDVRSEQSNDEAYPSVKDALDAYSSGIPFCELDVPGVMTMAQVDELISMETVTVLLGDYDFTLSAQRLLDAGITNSSDAFKDLVADLAACVGPEVSREMVIKLH